MKKFDAEVALGLGFEGNLRRDYKQYRLSNGPVEGVFGCAVTVFFPDTMFDTYGHDQVCKEIEEWMERRGLSMFGLMCNVLNKETHIIDRGIFLYTRHNNAFSNTFDKLLDACRASDLLQCGNEVRGTFGESEYSIISLGNNSISRKKWEIVFRAFYSSGQEEE